MNYTVDLFFLENAFGLYFTNLLMVFVNRENNCKVSIDNREIVTDKYFELAKKKQHVSDWLRYMLDFKPEPFHEVDVDLEQLDTISQFLFLCSSTIGQKELITNSKYDYDATQFKDRNIFFYESNEIIIYDKDEAIEIVNSNCSKKTQIIDKSINISSATIENSFNEES